MRKFSDDRIILCQPDNMKGCSLCCGLFNFRNISLDFLSGFLSDGDERKNVLADYTEYKINYNMRDEFAHVCPYQGFLNEDKPGCLIHPLSTGFEGRGRSLFAEKICSEFYCPAHTVLSEEEKFFLIQNISNWYLYSVAVADPESYSFIHSYIKVNCCGEDKSDKIVLLVNEGLAAHAENLASYDGVVFCYSVPEYNLNKNNFCIRYSPENMKKVITRIASANLLFI